MSNTKRLQHVLNAAARVVSGTGKYDSGLMKLHHPSCTGWTFVYVSSISLEWPFTGVFKITWWTAAHLPYRTFDVASSQRLRCVRLDWALRDTVCQNWHFSFTATPTTSLLRACNIVHKPDLLWNRKVTERWRAVIVNFIEFCSAFDYIYAPAMWKILVIWKLWGEQQHSENWWTYSSWFWVPTGVCILSPVLFAVIAN